MTELKTLSEKIKYEKERVVGINIEAWCVAQRIEQDVKEFIKMLKSQLIMKNRNAPIVDRLAGKDLVEEKSK